MSSASMTMSMSETASSSMSGMAMPTSSVTPGMGSSTMMDMGDMAMVFFTSAVTPLFSHAWTPAGPGQYTGTCIFLIVFAAIFRALLAFRAHFFDIVALSRRQQHAVAHQKAQHGQRPWRASESVMIAFVDMVLAGVGYLLMIAVMTMNIGYFLSVLAGVFVGSMIFARFGAQAAVC